MFYIKGEKYAGLFYCVLRRAYGECCRTYEGVAESFSFCERRFLL